MDLEIAICSPDPKRCVYGVVLEMLQSGMTRKEVVGFLETAVDLMDVGGYLITEVIRVLEG